MSFKTMLKEKPNTVAVIIAVIVILFPVGYSVISFVFAGGSRPDGPFVVMPAAKYDKCVRDTEFMRFHHWELLKEMRERVRDRNRGEINFDRCRECHTNRETFCNRCHDAVNLQPDCWGCHYYPETPEESGDQMHSADPGRDSRPAQPAPGQGG
jgi:hypothetical protein